MFIFNCPSQIKTQAFLVAVFVGLFLLATPAHSAMLEVSAAKQVGEKVTGFDDFTSVLSGDGISLSLQSSVSGDLSAKYRHGDIEQNIFSQTVKGGQEVFLPASDKFIVLSEPGVHEFILELNTPSGAAVRKVSVLVVDTNKPDVFNKSKKFSSSKVNTIEGVVYEPSVDLLGQLSYGPDELDIVTTRGVASEIYKELAPSVVLVAAENSMGTGSVISTAGEILTNWHVVGKSDTVAVIFKPGKFADVKSAEKYIADVIKVDEEKDLALIKLRNPPKGLRAIGLGDERDVEVAMDVHAIGHPKGNFWTYTKGVLSQIRPKFEWSTGQGVKHFADVIQTQTPINPGNSGGPLITDDRKIIGVNSFIDTDAQGLNFAVAITSVKEFVNSKKTHQKAEKVNVLKISVKGVKIDADKDGVEESIVYDKDQNGKIDQIGTDTTGDGEIDTVYIDADENDIAEMTIRLIEVDGQKAAIIGFDKDQDGKIETLGYDFDRDGEIDKYENV
jgi:S1-C subfamily serine protease